MSIIGSINSFFPSTPNRPSQSGEKSEINAFNQAINKGDLKKVKALYDSAPREKRNELAKLLIGSEKGIDRLAGMHPKEFESFFKNSKLQDSPLFKTLLVNVLINENLNEQNRDHIETLDQSLSALVSHSDKFANKTAALRMLMNNPETLQSFAEFSPEDFKSVISSFNGKVPEANMKMFLEKLWMSNTLSGEQKLVVQELYPRGNYEKIIEGAYPKVTPGVKRALLLPHEIKYLRVEISKADKLPLQNLEGTVGFKINRKAKILSTHSLIQAGQKMTGRNYDVHVVHSFVVTGIKDAETLKVVEAEGTGIIEQELKPYDAENGVAYVFYQTHTEKQRQELVKVATVTSDILTKENKTPVLRSESGTNIAAYNQIKAAISPFAYGSKQDKNYVKGLSFACADYLKGNPFMEVSDDKKRQAMFCSEYAAQCEQVAVAVSALSEQEKEALKDLTRSEVAGYLEKRINYARESIDGFTQKEICAVVPEATTPAFHHDKKEEDIFAARIFTYIPPPETGKGYVEAPKIIEV
ncbi:MAG: hypothetical protein H7A37_05335 [Chlamydiales bacterium]|nr:hypothetical protein [Chlamydiia bacterium]MCP5507702.1 hypothetical protein [Chlamydiales bacterium]